jgi:tetratricopeptide (TPR) repeat protein
MKPLRVFLRLIPLLLVLTACEVDQSPLVNANELFERAVSLFESGSYRQAEAFFTQALPLYEQQNDLSRLADSYAYLGRIHLASGQFKNALETATIAFEHGRKANDFRAQARIHVLMGDIYVLMSDYRKAIGQYESSFVLSEAFDDKPGKALSALRKGSALYWMNRWDEALSEYETALREYKAAGEEAKTALALLGMGEAYYRQGRYGEALNSLNQSKQVSASGSPQTAARLAVALGNTYRAMNEGNSALERFRDGANRMRTLRTGREYETLLLFSIGIVYAEGGRLDEAKRFFNEALTAARSSGDRLAENYLYLFIANVTERQIPAQQPAFQVEKRIESYIQIAERFRECSHLAGEAYSYGRAGDLYRSVGRLVEARAMYERAVELIEMRFAEFLNPELHLPYQKELELEQARESWYTNLASVLLQIRRPADALQVAERARSTALSRLLIEEVIPVRNLVLQKDMEEFRAKLDEYKLLQLEVSSLLSHRDYQAPVKMVQQAKTRLTALRTELGSAGARITASYPNYGPLTGGQPLTLGQLQTNIPRGTLLVLYLPTDNELSIFTVTRTNFDVKTVPVDRERLRGLTTEYLRLLRDPNVYAGAAGEASLPAMTRFATLSTQLYDILLRPVDALMDRNLVIVTGSEFENFPFHALERQERDGTIRYLAEITSVDYLTTLASIRFRVASTPRIQNVLAVGNPTGRNWSVDYELRDIRSFFKDANVLIGFEATWRNVAARADILQLSTDFRNTPGNHPFGSVALSDGETLDGSVEIPFKQLTSHQAFPVVVLSNTLGQGTGLTSLHAFLLRINGTSDVFFNAWGAERKASKFFSEFFYTHLSNGLAPGDAYRQALLNLIRTHEVSHPYSWAQFFHYGVG